MLLEFVVVSDGHGEVSLPFLSSGPTSSQAPAPPFPLLATSCGDRRCGEASFPMQPVPVGLRWACFLRASPRVPPPTLGSPGGWGWGGTNPLGAAVQTSLPLLPAHCFEVGPRAWLCRAAPRPVIRHVRSRLHLLITARSAGTLASPQTTFPSPQGRESLPQPCPQGCGPGAWVAGGTAHPVYKGLLGAGGLLGPCVLPGHCLPTTACLSQQDLS